MRAGLSTIQQTLTPEAASVLARSVEETARRRHGQTTPLHVAATLLASPSGLLRRACMSSHSVSAHPLQCRALELCFSVALDRLPSSSSFSGAEPSMSNALKAALKRAQANQRRGCPELLQQPSLLVAVKVELEQLLISILDDPSVSRVMREARFSSTAVKAYIEQSLSSSSSSSTITTTTAAVSTSPSPASPALSSPSSAGALGLNSNIRAAPVRNLYMNPRLHQHQPNGSGSAAGGVAVQLRTEEAKRVMDILLRSKKRNPILVGDSDPDGVMKEVLQKIESGDAPPPLRATKVVSFGNELAAAAVAVATGEASWILARIRELGSFIESDIAGDRGVVLDLGDLKWLVEFNGQASTSLVGTQPQQTVCGAGSSAVAEMGRLLKVFEGSGRVWLVGTATSTTYLRCQVYHPTMESEWDLQAVPIAPRSLVLPRIGVHGNLSSSVESRAPTGGFGPVGATAVPRIRLPESINSSRRTNLCPLCMESYGHELAKEMKRSSSKVEDNNELPRWPLAKFSNHLQAKEHELMRKQSKEEELLKKWQETCSRLHPESSHPVLLGSERPPAPTLSKPSSMFSPQPPFEPKSTLPRNHSPHQLLSNQENVMVNSSSELPSSPPGSPVKTDLVLGNSRASNSLPEKKTHKSCVQDLAECMQDEHRAKFTGISDIDPLKRLFKGLVEKVSWQQEAASAMATIVMQWKSGNGKRPGGGAKGDVWLLLIGPDKVGKWKMATALSELVFGTGPTAISFGGTSCANGDDGEPNVSSRGRTSMDRVVEAVRRNPFSVIVLEDVDQADGLVRGSIKRAVEQGRLLDSYGREVSLGSVIFILTSSWLPEELKRSHDSLIQCEEKILHSASRGWQLELSAERNPGKRCVDWLCKYSHPPMKLRRQSSSGTGLSLDLNLAAATEDESGWEGSPNSSDLTTEQHEHDKGRLATRCSTSSSASQLMELVDNAILFEPVDFAPLRRNVSESMSRKLAAVIGTGCSIEVDEDAVDRIVGGVWLHGASAFDEWAERVLKPSLKQLKLKAGGGTAVVRLSVVKGDGGGKTNSDRGWLPAKEVAIAVDGL